MTFEVAIAVALVVTFLHLGFLVTEDVLKEEDASE
jgi:hypothetical protein